MTKYLKLGGVLGVLVSLFCPAPLHAQMFGDSGAVNLIDVISDSAPNEVYHLGCLLNDQGQVTGYYYDNAFRGDGQPARRTYSLIDAANGVSLEQKKNGSQTYDLIRMKVTPVSGQAAQVVLDYLKNGLFNTRANLQLGFRSDPVNAQYVIYDPSTSAALHQAKIFVNKVGHTQVGIARIQVQ